MHVPSHQNPSPGSWRLQVLAASTEAAACSEHHETVFPLDLGRHTALGLALIPTGLQGGAQLLAWLSFPKSYLLMSKNSPLHPASAWKQGLLLCAPLVLSQTPTGMCVGVTEVAEGSCKQLSSRTCFLRTDSTTGTQRCRVSLG